MGGIGSSLITMLTIWLAFPAYGEWLYEMSEFPDWAKNHTICMNMIAPKAAHGVATVLMNATQSIVNATGH